ncbi:MAG: acyl-CoA dehydratase activase-related protein [Candidatus Helarchaeota archaeon]
MIVIKKRIGIPRSLLYYKYFPLWKTFLEELGVEIVLSDRTNSKIIDIGGRYAIDEICIPLKLYYGHVLNLLEKNIDYLFVPRYVSTTIGTYFCPKFLGLPDMVRGTIDNLPPIIEFEVNMQKRPMYLSAYKLGKVLHKSTWQIKKAYEKAIKDYKYFRQLMVDGLSFKKALNVLNSKNRNFKPKKKIIDYVAKIAIIGHGYNVHDSFINMNLINKLNKMKVNVVTLENLPLEIFKNQTVITNTLENYWGNEEEILSAVNYLFETKDIDGIIFICSFCCGPDSLIDEIMARDAKKLKIPYIGLVLDEHSGQAGVITRVEAFVDMIVRKKNNIRIIYKKPTMPIGIINKSEKEVGAEF